MTIDCQGYSEVIVSIIITRRTRYKRLAAGQHGPGQLTDSIQPRAQGHFLCNVLTPGTSHCHSYTKLAFRTCGRCWAKGEVVKGMIQFISGFLNSYTLYENIIFSWLLVKIAV